MLNVKDSFMQNLVPTVMVPLHEPLEPLNITGHRVLMAANGAFLEVRRNWLHLVHQIATVNDFVLPYGTVEPITDLLFDFPLHLVRDFYRDSQERLPNECGGWIIQDMITGEFRYELLTSLKATGSYLEIVRPQLVDHETLVVDLHSHGFHPSGFSSIDNNDDAGCYKISGVIGSMGEGQTPTSTFRLCVGGIFIPLKVNTLRITESN